MCDNDFNIYAYPQESQWAAYATHSRCLRWRKRLECQPVDGLTPRLVWLRVVIAMTSVL